MREHVNRLPPEEKMYLKNWIFPPIATDSLLEHLVNIEEIKGYCEEEKVFASVPLDTATQQTLDTFPEGNDVPSSMHP